MTQRLRVHFVGIFGSGASGVAIAASKMGFDVSGCDMADDTPYAAQARAAEIPVAIGHDAQHVADADLVAVSPALFAKSIDNPEIDAARTAGKLTTWQRFLGEHILPGRRTIAICGTHGKTTTTAIVAHLLICAGLDPTAFVGAIVPEWGGSNRIGESDWVILEADEYANNFAPYHPQFIILNNLEMEHPEYFRDFEHYKQTFRDFLNGAAPGAVLIYNADDAGAVELATDFGGEKIPFSAARTKISSTADGQDFDGLVPRSLGEGGFHINLLGTHNVSNAAAAIALARRLGVSDDKIRDCLGTFRGAGHRLEKIHDTGGVKIYDDYAHHHTQAARSIAALRGSHPDDFLIVAYEPHQISRWTQNTAETLAVLAAADAAMIVEFWRGREAHLDVPDAVADIQKFGATHIQYIPNFDAAADAIAGLARKHANTTILVMGAGKSYKLAALLKNKFPEFPSFGGVAPRGPRAIVDCVGWAGAGEG